MIASRCPFCGSMRGCVRTFDEVPHPRPINEATELLSGLRASGWSVAVHNDYQQGGEAFTFWLLTHPDGRWVKGEGRTDRDALRQVVADLGSTAPERDAQTDELLREGRELGREARERWDTSLGRGGVAMLPQDCLQPPPRSSAQGAREVADRIWCHIDEDSLGPSFVQWAAEEIDAYAEALAAEREREALERAERVALEEPELPGPMPDRVRKQLLSLSLGEQQRAAVRTTKKSIAAAIRSLIPEPPE